jgi:tetratricopeptide (TPR) repeat protein
MKIIIYALITLLLLYAGLMSYSYIDLSGKNKQLTLALDEAGDFKRSLQEEISRRDTLQEALQKENEQLKKESLTHLSQQKKINDKQEETEKALQQQNQKLSDLRKQLEAARKELAGLKQENLRLADINKFAANIEIKKQEEKIGQLETDLSSAQEQMKKQEALLHYNLGITYTKEKSYEMAIDEYEKALKLNPQDADTHYNLAIIYDEVRRNPKRSIEHYQKYLELKPDAADIDEVKDWIARLEK